MFPQLLEQRPRELGDQDAPLALSPVAQERDNRSGLGRGRKRASEQGPRMKPSASRSATRQPRTQRGGVTARGSRPPPPPPTRPTSLQNCTPDK